MASVFLSYSREDAAKAKSLAKALERAGHDVWWDRHIRGGSQFAGAIEQALRNADAVLVLWSKASVDSPWVRDEASEGRDSNRLVPVVLDDSRPPIGFRQFQSIDFSGWSGKGTPKHFADLLNALDDEVPEAADRQSDEESPPTAGAQRSGAASPLQAALIALAVIAAILLGTWLYFDRNPAGAETPTIAVLPFADLSPAGDKGYFAEGVAEEILSLLAKEPGIAIIGRSSSWQFRERSLDLAAIRRGLGVTHILEGSTRTLGDELILSVRLVDAKDGTQVWAEDYRRQLSNVFAMQDEIGRAVADRLRGSLATPFRRYDGRTTGTEAYTLYLGARSKMRKRDEQNLREAIELARQVITMEPDYGPGHALYAELISLLASNPFFAPRNASYFFTGPDPRAFAYTLAKSHAKRAIKLSPEAPEGYAALGFIERDPEAALVPLRRAIALDPSRSELRLWLGGIYTGLGRNSEAFEQTRTAAEMDPLLVPAVRSLASFYSTSGRFDDAESVAAQFVQRGGAPAQAARIRSHTAHNRGDLHEAVRQSRLANRLDPDPHDATILFIYYHPNWLGLPERAAQLDIPEEFRDFSRLVVSGRNQAELARVRSEGAGAWIKPYNRVYFFALAAARDWPHLESLYDSRTSSLSQICLKETVISISLVMALENKRRGEEASRLRACVQNRLAGAAVAPLRSGWLSEPQLSFDTAQILALQGDRASAVRALNRAVDQGWRGLDMSPKLADYPALDSLRSSPEYSRIQTRVTRTLRMQREELLREGATSRG